MVVMRKVLNVVKIMIPIICVVVFALCWIMDIVKCNTYGHSFDGQPPEFWETIEIISKIMLIDACVFAVSFPVFMLVRPLPEKNKARRIALRILISVMGCGVFLFFSYVSLGAFVGFGG